MHQVAAGAVDRMLDDARVERERLSLADPQRPHGGVVIGAALRIVEIDRGHLAVAAVDLAPGIRQATGEHQAYAARQAAGQAIGAGQDRIQSRRWIGSSPVAVDRGSSCRPQGEPEVATGSRALKAAG